MRKFVQPLVLGDPALGGFRGLNTCGSNNDLANGQSPLSYNYMVSNTGLEKRKGCNKYNSTEIGSGVGVTGVKRFYDGSVFHTFAKVGTSIYDVAVSGASTSRLSGLSASAYVDFANWFTYCFVADGSKMYKSSGAAFSEVVFLDEEGNTLTTYPRAKSPTLHNERFYMLDTLNPTRVYYTVTDFSDRFISDGAGRAISYVVCDRDDGRALVGLVRTADRIMAFKKEQTYFILGDYTDGNLTVYPGPPSGAFNQRCIVMCPDGFVRWFGPDGVWEYRDDVGPICISRHKELELDIEAELKNISYDNTDKCCMEYFDHYVLLFYPKGPVTHNDHGLIYDTIKNEWMMIKNWDVSSLTRFEDDTLAAGWATSGHVKKLFNGYNDDGAPIECYYQTKFFGTPGVVQFLDSLRGRIIKGRSFKFSWLSDPYSGTSGTVIFDYGVSNRAVLGNRDKPAEGTFTLGDKTDPGKGSTLSNRDMIVAADFVRRLSYNQNYREISFGFFESSTIPHQIDYVEVRSIPSRRVV